MLKTINVQLKKVFFRSDVKTSILIFLLIPFVIAYLISIESGIIQIGNSVFSALGYASVVIGLLKSLFLIGGIVAFISTAVISKEIDFGLDCTYFTKLKKSEHLYISKNITLLVFVTVIFISLLVSSVIGWFLFLRGTTYGNLLFLSSDKSESILLIFSIISAYLEMVFMCELFCLISLILSYSKAIIVNLVLIVILKLLANVELLQRWNPSFIGDAVGLFKYTGKELVYRGFEGVIIILLYTILLSIYSINIYRKMDLVR